MLLVEYEKYGTLSIYDMYIQKEREREREREKTMISLQQQLKCFKLFPVFCFRFADAKTTWS